MILVGNIIPITDKPDKNGRIYPKEVLEKAIAEFNKNLNKNKKVKKTY